MADGWVTEEERKDKEIEMLKVELKAKDKEIKKLKKEIIDLWGMIPHQVYKRGL
jgi:predicted RNase H-like nuclease (RuvC/YqgF family)